MNNFIIGDSSHFILFHSPRFQSDGWLTSYLITVKTIGLEATKLVENPPYGFPPSVFFKKLSNYWQHWKPEYDWEAMEGEFGFSAHADSLGHITVIINLNSCGEQPYWNVEMSIEIEAGQLENLAENIRQFFELR